MLMVHVDAATMARLHKAAEETGRAIEDLAADGVAEFMLAGFRDRPNEDPGRKVRT